MGDSPDNPAVSGTNTFARSRSRSCLLPGIFRIINEQSKWHNYCELSTRYGHTKSKTCFTITFSDEQYDRAKGYVEDMKRHPNRIFWQGKQGKTDQELIIEQIAHRILSGFYNNEPFVAGKHIMRMDSSTNV